MSTSKSELGSGLGVALKAAYLAREIPAPGIAYLPGKEIQGNSAEGAWGQACNIAI